jgi:hypothetical protein
VLSSLSFLTTVYRGCDGMNNQTSESFVGTRSAAETQRPSPCPLLAVGMEWVEHWIIV